MPHFISLMHSVDIRLLPADINDYSESKLFTLPEGYGFIDGEDELSEYIESVIDEIVAEKRDQIIEFNREYGAAACLTPPPDWLIVVGKFFISAIFSGVIYEIASARLKPILKNIIKQYKKELGFDDEAELVKEIGIYFDTNFFDEKNLRQLYKKLEEMQSEVGTKFDLSELERRNAELISQQILEEIRIKEERKARERLELKNNIENLISLLIESDKHQSANIQLAVEVCNNIDTYLIHGIESVFIVPHYLPDVDKALIEILNNIQIPDVVLEQFANFQILDGKKLTEVGRKVFRLMVLLRPKSQTRGKLPNATFNSVLDKSQS